MSKTKQKKQLFQYIKSILVETWYILFTSRSKSFAVTHRPKANGLWLDSYVRHVQFQRGMRLFSASFFVLLVTSVMVVSIVLQVLFPTYETEFALANTDGTRRVTSTLTVLNLKDSGFGSLRTTIAVSGDGDTIVFNNSLDGSIALKSPLGLIDKNITIDGSGANITLDGTDAVSQYGNVHGIACRAQMTMRSMEIKNFSGNGIHADADCANSTFDDLTISNNGENGVMLFQTSGITVSDSTITNNAASGIYVLDSSDNGILGNSIGTISPGDSGYGNSVQGILVAGSGSTNNTIGGNTVRGNGKSGIAITNQSANNTVVSNTVRANTENGITLIDASNITIGGDSTPKGNVLADNGHNGLWISSLSYTSNGHTIKNNSIGMLADGTADGNGQHGILVENNSASITIGDVSYGNIIANNAGLGVLVDGNGTTTSGVRIVGNQIYNNGGLLGGVTLDARFRAIDLVDNGNGEVAEPSLGECREDYVIGVSTVGGTIHLYKSDNGNQSRTYLGSTTAEANKSWTINGDFSTYDSFVATITNSGNSTSGFSLECAKTVTPDTSAEPTTNTSTDTGSTTVQPIAETPSNTNTTMPEQSPTDSTTNNTNNTTTDTNTSSDNTNDNTDNVAETNPSVDTSNDNSSKNTNVTKPSTNKPANDSVTSNTNTSPQQSSGGATETTNAADTTTSGASSAATTAESSNLNQIPNFSTSDNQNTDETAATSDVTTTEDNEVLLAWETSAPLGEEQGIRERLTRANSAVSVSAEKVIQQGKKKEVLPMPTNNQGESVLQVRRVIGLKPLPLSLFPTTSESSNIIFTGKTDPYAAVRVEVRSDPIVKVTRADKNGEWKLSIPADIIPAGEHSAFLQTESRGVQSDTVEIAKFVVVQEDRISNTTWIFIGNLLVAAVILMVAITMQVHRRRKYLEKHLTSA